MAPDNLTLQAIYPGGDFVLGSVTTEKMGYAPGLANHVGLRPSAAEVSLVVPADLRPLVEPVEHGANNKAAFLRLRRHPDGTWAITGKVLLTEGGGSHAGPATLLHVPTNALPTAIRGFAANLHGAAAINRTFVRLSEAVAAAVPSTKTVAPTPGVAAPGTTTPAAPGDGLAASLPIPEFVKDHPVATGVAGFLVLLVVVAIIVIFGGARLVKVPKLFAGAGGLLLLGVLAFIAWRVYQKKRHASAVAIVPGV